MSTIHQLERELAALGVVQGESVLIHSSFKSLGEIKEGPLSIINTLLNLVGIDGTVLFPAFNFQSWSETHYFDILHTESKMGILSELARADNRFKRTLHPMYSFVVAGKFQDEFCKLDSSNCYGPGSVFDFLTKTDALILSIGLDFNSTFSITHHAEKISGACTYRYDKDFSGIYIGYDRVPRLTTYTMTVRNRLLKVETDIRPAMGCLLDEGVITAGNIGKALSHSTKAAVFVKSLLPIITDKPEWLHRSEI